MSTALPARANAVPMSPPPWIVSSTRIRICRSDKGERPMGVFDHQLCEQRIDPNGVCVYERDSLPVEHKRALLHAFSKADLGGNVFFDMDAFCKKERDDHKHIDIFFFEFGKRVADGGFIDVHETAFDHKLRGLRRDQFSGRFDEFLVVGHRASMAYK